MEEEKDRYYRLFYPLSYDQEKEILNIWKSNIIKDFYNKNKEINKYCEEKGYDYMMALYSIYKSFPVYYICSYFEQNSSSCEIINDYINSFELRNFITNRIKRIKISKSNDSFLEDIENKIETMFNVLERENFYGFSQAKEQGFHDFNLININSIYQNVEEEEILKDIISDEIKKRRANPNVYIKKELITKVREGIDTIPEYRLTGFEELMYLPYDSNSIGINIETTNTQEVVSDDSINSETNNKQVNKRIKELPKVEIDVEALKLYFKPNFTAPSDTSNFDTFIDDLRGELPTYKDNDIAAVSLLIYESNRLHNYKKPKTFSKWFNAFCKMINHNNSTYYKPCKLKDKKEQHIKTFYYL